MVREVGFGGFTRIGDRECSCSCTRSGRLSSKSGLNQNFSGDITLLSVQAEELDSVRSNWLTLTPSSVPAGPTVLPVAAQVRALRSPAPVRRSSG